MNPNHHWKLFFINQPLFLCYLSVLLFHRSIKHFSMYLKRKISLSFTLEVKILRKRQSSSPWKKGGSYIGWKQYGGAMLMIMVIMMIMSMVKMMRECLLQNGRWIIFSYLPFLVPSQPGTGAGWGGAQRRDPTGGEAYGMDLPIFLAIMIFKRQGNS